MKRALTSFLCLFVVVGAFAQTPPAPTDLTAQQVNDNHIAVKLTWQAPDSIREFRVYRSVNDTSHFQLIGSNTPMLNRTFFDNMVMVGTRYFYFVRSVRGGMMSDPSNVVDILVTPPPPPPPSPTPTNPYGQVHRGLFAVLRAWAGLPGRHRLHAEINNGTLPLQRPGNERLPGRR